MRILHTSDWHLGKSIEEYSRINEQGEFLQELEQIADDKEVDLIIVAGDVYDVSNPPAEAERLFYKSMSRLTKDGKRPVLIVAGNHDNPDRLTAASPIALDKGLILVGTPKTVIETGKFGGFEIVNSGSGFLEIKIKDETAVVLTMAYPSEKRLNEVFESENTSTSSESEFRKSYNERIKEMFLELEQNFRPDTINLVAGHFHIKGGEVSESERDIVIGGLYAVESESLPSRAQYIAMGHLHRMQKINDAERVIYYSGSPMAYKKGEHSQAKAVNLVEVLAGLPAVVEKIYLKNYRPVEVWRTQSIEAAIELCRERSDDDCLVYIEIISDRTIKFSEHKEMTRLKSGILYVDVQHRESNLEKLAVEEDKTIEQEFFEFYMLKENCPPSQELVQLFLQLVNEEADE